MRTVLLAALLCGLAAADLGAQNRRKSNAMWRDFVATAYSQEGTTADGSQARERTAAADPAVLPLGTVIQVRGAGRRYDGRYKIVDTGSRIDGNEIDIYVSNDAEAKQFGKKPVRVRVVSMPEPKSSE